MCCSFDCKVLICLVVVMVALPASAQQNATPPTARDVLPLITEEVALEAGEPPTVGYWWVEPGRPQWTESDERIRRQLREAGVDLVELSGDVSISRIYRTPNLSASNAATLGSLVDAKRVLVGTIAYERETGVGPLDLQRVAASADVSLVSAESGETAAISRFTVEREGFAADADEALEQVRRQTTDALATLMARTLMRGPGPVGVQSDERLIGLRNPHDASVLEAVTTFLEELDTVDSVQVRWAAEGLIALEVNPGQADAEDVVEYAIRALRNQSFEEFRLDRRSRASAAGLTEFDVTMRETGRF